MLPAHAGFVDRYPVSGRVLIPLDVVGELVEYVGDAAAAEGV